MTDKKLTPARIFTSGGHSHRTAFEFSLIIFTGDMISRTAPAVAPGITPLDDEITYYPVKGKVIIEFLPD